MARKHIASDAAGKPLEGKGGGEVEHGSREHAEYVINVERGSMMLPDGRQVTHMDQFPSDAEMKSLKEAQAEGIRIAAGGNADRRESTGGRVRDAEPAPVVGSEPKSESKSR